MTAIEPKAYMTIRKIGYASVVAIILLILIPWALGFIDINPVKLLGELLINFFGIIAVLAWIYALFATRKHNEKKLFWFCLFLSPFFSMVLFVRA